MKDYKPNPADTNSVELPEELRPLIEEMAKNVHEVWAQDRINEGWTNVSVRNEELIHPDLIPYSKLPDSDKVYERLMNIHILLLSRLQRIKYC